MIDYDRLKEAEPGYIGEILTEIIPSDGSISVHAGEYRIIDGRWYAVKKTDKPEKLTQPEPKYKVDDEVWTYTHGHINTWRIKKITWEPENNDFRLNLTQTFGDASIMESNCHPTKAALIEAQIEYWHNLYEGDCPVCAPEHLKEPEYCNHPETIGVPYGIKFICTHCGEAGLSRPDKETEYCNVSGAKLGKREECQHESDGMLYSESPIALVQRKYKCIKCGEFYR